MTITTITLVDDAEKTITQTTDTALGSISTTTSWKAGTPQFNLDQLQQRATTALVNNATFLAITAPTQAQAVAQVKALTRQVNALIRLQLSALSDISDS